MKLTPTNITTLSLITTALFSGVVLSSSLVSADDDSVVDEINITVPVACTMSGTGMNTHNAEINNGQYNSAIGETTLKAFCNDNEGFAIYTIGYTDNEEGKNVLTNSTLSSSYDIVTGTATSGNTSNWAMKLSTITSPAPTYPIIITGTNSDTLKEQGDPDFSSFQAVPDDYTKVAYRTASTDTGTNTEGSTLTTTYQAYISKTQPAGTYTGQVKYTLVHPHDTTAPEKPLYLHEVNEWKEAKLPNIGDSVEAIDIRDGKTYLVSRLNGNRIWLMENLKLDPTDQAVGAKMNESNTNASMDAIRNYYDGNISVSGWTTSPIANLSSGFNSNTEPQINNTHIESVSNDSMDQANQWKTGVLYNYCAATVGTYCYEYGSEYDAPDSLIDAVYDLCPANWRMPTGGSSGEYQALYSQYNTYTTLRNTFRLPMTGFYATSSLVMGGEIGNYWSSTFRSYQAGNEMTYQIYTLTIHRPSSSVGTTNSNNRTTGYPIRCIVK